MLMNLINKVVQTIPQWPTGTELQILWALLCLFFIIVVFFFIIIFILQVVAFLTLMERHFLGGTQCRIGPNKVG
uniref:NADH dehydrogenase subunit 1, identical n=1 Tax=Brugia malayi TaxID=6279 RepID=A8QE13_BRUMA